MTRAAAPAVFVTVDHEGQLYRVAFFNSTAISIAKYNGKGVFLYVDWNNDIVTKARNAGQVGGNNQ